MSVAKLSTQKLRNVGRVGGVSPSLLRRFSRLGGLSDARLERIARGSECQLIPAGNMLFTQGDGADSVYLLLDGEVDLEHREMDGDVVEHRLFGPFASFGDVALLGEQNRYYTATTGTASMVVRTPLSMLREVLATNPELAQAWIHAVTSDLQRRERHMADSLLRNIASPAFPDAA